MKKNFTDQLGRKIEINSLPQKIISLVPSQTEFLFDINLSQQIIGITKFCIHPQELVKGKAKIGGTKNVNLEKIKILNPDLIIANKEENKKEQIQELSKLFPVWVSDVENIDDALKMMESLGEITGKMDNALSIIKKVREGISELKKLKVRQENNRVAYFIWRKPWMVAGSNNFIDEMLSVCGFHNVFKYGSRYPVVTAEDVRKAAPDFIFLSSEPYPFEENHFKEFNFLPQGTNVLLVDGEMFSWYGSRMIRAIKYFKSLLIKLKMADNATK